MFHCWNYFKCAYKSFLQYIYINTCIYFDQPLSFQKKTLLGTAYLKPATLQKHFLLLDILTILNSVTCLNYTQNRECAKYVTTSVSQLAIIIKSFLFSWQMKYIISLIFENWLLIIKKNWLLFHCYASFLSNKRFVVIVTSLMSLTLINSFSFSQVMPGKYHVKASHSSWTFENVSLQCSTSGKLTGVNNWYAVKEKERHAGIWLMSINCGN